MKWFEEYDNENYNWNSKLWLRYVEGWIMENRIKDSSKPPVQHEITNYVIIEKEEIFHWSFLDDQGEKTICSQNFNPNTSRPNSTTDTLEVRNENCKISLVSENH